MKPDRVAFLRRWIAANPQRIDLERGRVYLCDDRSAMAAIPGNGGYLRAPLVVDGVRRLYAVQEVIAAAVGLEIEGDVRVVHVNGDRLDNRPANLKVVPCPPRTAQPVKE